MSCWVNGWHQAERMDWDVRWLENALEMRTPVLKLSLEGALPGMSTQKPCENCGFMSAEKNVSRQDLTDGTSLIACPQLSAYY